MLIRQELTGKPEFTAKVVVVKHSLQGTTNWNLSFRQFVPNSGGGHLLCRNILTSLGQDTWFWQVLPVVRSDKAPLFTSCIGLGNQQSIMTNYFYNNQVNPSEDPKSSKHLLEFTLQKQRASFKILNNIYTVSYTEVYT